MKVRAFFGIIFALLLPSGKPAQAAMVYVREGNTIIRDTDSSVQWPLASITKLMTTLVLMDMQVNWNGSVKLTRADEVGGARLRVAVGGVYRRIDLLHAALMGSANNAINALARSTGLTRKQFVARMNAKAQELGMTDTHFVDPSGIQTANV